MELLDRVLKEELARLHRDREMMKRLAAKFDITVDEVDVRLEDETPNDAFEFIQTVDGLVEIYFEWIIGQEGNKDENK